MTRHVNLTPSLTAQLGALAEPGRASVTRPTGTQVAQAADGGRVVIGPDAPRGAAARRPGGELLPLLTQDAPEIVKIVADGVVAQARADLAHQYIGDANVRLVSLEASRTSMREDIAGAHTRLVSLESSRGSILADLASAGSRIGSLETSRGAILTDLASAGGRIGTLEGQVGPLVNPSTGVGARLAGHDSQISGIFGDLASASSRINGKADQSSLNATNGRVGSLETGKASTSDLQAVAGGVTNLQSAIRSYFNSLSSYVEANFQKTGSSTRPVWPGGD